MSMLKGRSYWEQFLEESQTRLKDEKIKKKKKAPGKYLSIHKCL